MEATKTHVNTSKNPIETAVVLIDPVSSGKHLKSYVHSLGHKLVAVFTLTEEQLISSGKNLAPEEKYRYCDQVLQSNQLDAIESWLKSLPVQIVAIIGASEPAVELADLLAHKFGVRGNNPDTSFLRRNKYEARLAVQKAGLDGPDFRKCSSKADLLDFLENHPFPVVLKTPEGAGAHHVFVCHTLAQALNAHQTILTEPNLFGKGAPYSLAEEFIQGDQFVVEMFAIGGEIFLTSIWEFEFGNRNNGRIEFERARLITDSGRASQLSDLVSYAKSVAQALDVQWGPCLVELRKNPIRGPQLIEMGARLSGIELPVIVREVSNFDPFLETLKVFIGMNFESGPTIEFKKCAALTFLGTSEEGVVKAIHGVDQIQGLSSYFMSFLNLKAGCQVSPSRDLATIPLYVYLVHENGQTIAQDEILSRRYFRVELVNDNQLRKKEPLELNESLINS